MAKTTEELDRALIEACQSVARQLQAIEDNPTNR